MQQIKSKIKKGPVKGGKINNPKRSLPTGRSFKDKSNLRSRATIRRLKMYKTKPKRNKKGQIVSGQLMSTRPDTPVVRVQPDRKWFGNTRIIGQKDLDTFREEMKVKDKDPYTVILRRKHLPTGLLADTSKIGKSNVLGVETFDYTFGTKSQRKRPKLKANSLESLLQRAEKSNERYESKNDGDQMDQSDGFMTSNYVNPIFKKGQSDRIKGELYKVIDSSDVLIQVLDARDPIGTRSYHVEKYLQTQCAHKHLILVLNKVDLVPTWVVARWIKHLSSQYPTLAFHAKISKSFGKGSLIQLLRQFQRLHPERQKISVGFFGYPNVGKSSVINTLKEKVVCKVASIPGETKVWQYITLTNNIYLVDCPGVVYPKAGETDAGQMLKGVVRVEQVKDAEQYIDEILERIRPEYIERTYGFSHWDSPDDFLTRLAKRYGKLLKGGEPDYHNVAMMLLHDWVRGKLPWFVCPPFEDDLEKIAAEEKKQKEEKEKMQLEDAPDMEFEPVQILRDIIPVHDFIEKDQTEEAYYGKIIKKGGPTEKELAEIDIANPLGLEENDPLIIAAKTRIWNEKQKKSLKKHITPSLKQAGC